MIDPLESFEVHNIFSMELFGMDISMTNSSLYMILTTILICVLMFLGTRDRGIIPNKLQSIIEKLFFFVGDIVKDNLGKESMRLFPYMFSLFMFIMFGNMIGLFPYAFSFTSQIVITIGMASIVFVASIIIGFYNQGLKYFRHFCPKEIPVYIAPFFAIIELMSFLFRPISLGIRLFANMVSGHIMIKVIAGFAVSLAGMSLYSYCAIIPIVFNTLLNVFKLIVCMLQAYVFVILSCVYIAESLNVDHD